jgi:hypothetical protein
MTRVDEILALGDRLLPELSNHVFGRVERVGLDGLSEAERTFHLVDNLLLEVNNGGFLQYFTNSAGDSAREAVTCLERLGARHTASLLRRALAAFGPDGPSRDWELRRAQVDVLAPSSRQVLADLDDEFYERDDAAALELPFVMAHRAELHD